MTTKYVMSGDTLNYVAGSNLSAGAVVVIGVRVAVLLADIASGATGAVRVQGVFNLAKLSTDVVAQGDLLYWDAGNSRLTTTASTHKVAGYAAQASGNGVTTCWVNLNA